MTKKSFLSILAVALALPAGAAHAVSPQFHSASAASASASVATRVYGDPDYTRGSRNTVGNVSVSSGASLASAGASLGPRPYAAAYVVNDSGSGSGYADASLTYEYLWIAQNSNAANALIAYLGAHNGYGANILGAIKLNQAAQYGSASGSITAGSASASFGCSDYYLRSASACGNHVVNIVGTLTQISATAFNGFITLTASASMSEGGSGLFGPPSFGAYVDPIISLAGGFNPADFTLSFSPGVANATGGSIPFGGGGGGIGPILPPPGPGGVPEPATWALLISGFGMIGAVARRRRDRLAIG